MIDLLEPEQALEPAVVRELVESRCSPVVRARRTVDAEDDGLPGREGDPLVVRIPDDANGARLRLLPADVPRLPVEGRIGSERRRRRGSRGSDHDERRDEATHEHGAPRRRAQEQRDREGGGERERPDGYRASPEQRGRPADRRDRDCCGGERPPRRNQQCGREDEAEDRAEDERVHLRASSRLEWQKDGIEVDDAVRSVLQGRSEDTLVAERQ